MIGEAAGRAVAAAGLDAALGVGARGPGQRFEVEQVDDLDLLVRTYLDASGEARAVADATDRPTAPRVTGSIPGVVDGVAVLDPSLSAAQARGQLARYAPVLQVDEGALHVDGAPVQRDLARWLGHPIADLTYPDGTRRLVHAERQVGASGGYPTLDEARFAARQVLGPGPDGNPGVEGVALLRASDLAGVPRWTLAATDQPLSRSRTVQRMFGAGDPVVESPTRARALSYLTEVGEHVPAQGLLGRDGVEADLATTRSAPPGDAGSVIPRGRLDAMSIVGQDPASLVRRAEIEGWMGSLADRIARVSPDPHLVQRLRSPGYAERLARAEATMVSLRLDESSGWTPEHLASFRDALVESGNDAPAAEVALGRVAPYRDQLMRNGFTSAGEVVVPENGQGLAPENRDIVKQSLGVDGRAALVRAALRSRTQLERIAEHIPPLTQALDAIFEIPASAGGRTVRFKALEKTGHDARATYVGAAAHALGNDVSSGDIAALRDAVLGTGLDHSTSARLFGMMAESRLPAERAIEVARAAPLSAADTATAVRNIEAALRVAEREAS